MTRRNRMFLSAFGALIAGAINPAFPVVSITISDAKIQAGRLIITGVTSTPNAVVRLDNRFTTSLPDGRAARRSVDVFS